MKAGLVCIILGAGLACAAPPAIHKAAVDEAEARSADPAHAPETPPQQPPGAAASPGSDAGVSPGAGMADARAAAPVATPPPVIAPPPLGTMPSAACSVETPPPPTGYQTIQNNGKARKFILRVPAAYDGKKPYPVVFAFSGAQHNATEFDTGFGFRKTIGDKAVLVFPEALVYDQVGYTTWMRDAADDVAFFDTIVGWLKSKVCFDLSRIFSTGSSSGAYFSNTLGCQRGNVLRAIGSISGGPRAMINCVNTVAAWIALGNMDPDRSGVSARDFWVKRNGCTPQNPLPTTPAPCVAYQGCRDGYPVHWCEFQGGHMWPSFATSGVWDFFSKF